MTVSPELISKVVSVATVVVTGASAFCAATPTPEPTSFLGKIYKLIEFLALNIGKAKQ